jgi:hypothetical protein
MYDVSPLLPKRIVWAMLKKEKREKLKTISVPKRHERKNGCQKARRKEKQTKKER